MLTISRRQSEAVVFTDQDGNVVGTLVIKEIRGNQVRIGLDFDNDITIIRDDAGSTRRSDDGSQRTT